MARAKKILVSNMEFAKATFCGRIRSDKRATCQIAQLSRRGREHLKNHYRRLMGATRATVRLAEVALAGLQTTMAEQGHKLIDTLQTFLPRVEQVLEQAKRRVVNSESVPVAAKLVSILAPHPNVIRRGESNKETELGH